MGLTVYHIRLRDGIWEGVIICPAEAKSPPEIEVIHLDEPISDVELRPNADNASEWVLRFPIPSKAIADGMQSLIIREVSSGDTLGSYTMINGQVLDEDFRLELELLRAEVSMLKKAFRRHCSETT